MSKKDTTIWYSKKDGKVRIDKICNVMTLDEIEMEIKCKRRDLSQEAQEKIYDDYTDGVHYYAVKVGNVPNQRIRSVEVYGWDCIQSKRTYDQLYSKTEMTEDYFKRVLGTIRAGADRLKYFMLSQGSIEKAVITAKNPHSYCVNVKSN